MEVFIWSNSLHVKQGINIFFKVVFKGGAPSSEYKLEDSRLGGRGMEQN